MNTGSVEYGEHNLIITSAVDSVVPTDFLFMQQWHLRFRSLCAVETLGSLLQLQANAYLRWDG
jgi:hypothetical protein